jgi:hypothetical protein
MGGRNGAESVAEIARNMHPHLSIQFPQITFLQRVFIVTAEVPDDLLKIDCEIHGLLVNRQMLVPRHL